jgi:hypothetical protein
MEEDAEDAEKEYDVLIRCTDGLEINFATRVSYRMDLASSRLLAPNSRFLKGRCSPIRIRRKG